MRKFYKRHAVVFAEQYVPLKDDPRIVLVSGVPHIKLDDASSPISPGDWIVTNEFQETFVCKNEVFQKLYEAAHE